MYSDSTLWKYLDGELDADTSSALEAAATGDARLGTRIAELRALKQGVLDGAPRPPGEFAARVADLAVRERPSSWDAEEARRFLRGALLAASLLAAVGILALASRLVPDLVGAGRIQAKDPILGR